MGCCLASAIDAGEAQSTLREEAPDILLENEEVEFAFAFTRDIVYFTNIRILFKDKKGITGSRIGWKSYGYHIIKAMSVETAGTMDMSVELKIWASGDCNTEVSFKQGGGVDIFALQRMINRRIFHADSVGKKLDQEAATAPVQEAMADDSMSNFLDLLGSDARSIDPKVLEKQLKTCPPVLDEDETVELAYRCGRDTTALTSNRVLIIDIQGWTGKKVNYMSYLWKCIRAFAVATPGAFLDRDAEMKFWTNITGYEKRVFEQDLRGGVDVMVIQKFFTDRLLGPDTAAASEHAASTVDAGGGWQAWLGDQRMIDAKEADLQFRTTTPILQNSEQVEMAFKGKRDMMLFTTKRLILIDPQGFFGKKIEYTSIPWKTVQMFGVQSAGSFFDIDAEMMIWTDIFYDPPPPKKSDDEPDPPPLPGMSYIEQDFAKDKVDLACVGRYLAERCAPLGKDASNAPAAPQNLEMTSDPNGFTQFLQMLGNDYRQVDPEQLDNSLHKEAPLLLPDEKVQMGFACGRDTFVLTTHRALKVDVQGWTGKKVLYLSAPYVNCRGYSVESAGTWDTDAEMEMYFKAPWFQYWHSDGFKIDFGKASADIIAIQKFLTSQLIGKADGLSVVPRALIPKAEPGLVGQFLNWIGDDAHQIDSAQATEKFTSDPAILLPDETIELAFKCGRDLTIFTTKRLLQIDVKGWTGKKVNFLTTPMKYIAGFEVENVGKFDLDATVNMKADSPGTEKATMDIKAGQGDLMGCYKLLYKKTICDRLQVI